LAPVKAKDEIHFVLTIINNEFVAHDGILRMQFAPQFTTLRYSLK
jgi:hypothetical protein